MVDAGMSVAGMTEERRIGAIWIAFFVSVSGYAMDAG
jgi:hypothetical protein